MPTRDENKVDFIFRAHDKIGQKYGDLPYHIHLEQTRAVADRFATAYPFLVDPAIQLACLGHDILEDTPTKEEDLIAAGFPERAIRIIKAVTDVTGEPGEKLSRKEKKARTYPKIHGDMEATAVKLCDRIANVENCIATGDSRLQMYRRELAEMEKALRIPGQLDALWEHLHSLFEMDHQSIRAL